MNQKAIAGFLAAALLLSALGACGRKTNLAPASSAASSAPASALAPTSALSAKTLEQELAAQTALNLCIGPEPVTLDPACSTGADTDAYAAAAFEGLYKYDAAGNLVLGQAEKAEVSKDRKTWTFTLRPNLRWSDGAAVKAADFVYAWKRNVVLKSAPERSLFAYLKNGQAILAGSQGADTLGVRAADDRTLEVQLAAPCAFLSQLLVRPVFMPLRREAAGSGKDWTHDPEKFLCNGPMKLLKWSLKSDILFARSNTYYNQAAITASRLRCDLSEDDNARLTAYDNNETNLIFPFPVKYYTRIRERGDWISGPAQQTVCAIYNTRISALSDEKVRQAMTLALDRDALAVSLTGMRFQPAAAFVAPGMPDANGKGDFRAVGGACYPPVDAYESSVSQAKDLMRQAGYPDGRDFPQLTITVPISTLDSTVAQAIASMWKKALGISCQVVQQPYKTYVENCRAGKVAVTLQGLTPAYNDASAILENFAVGGGPADISGFQDEAFQKQMETARVAASAASRFQALHAAEKRLAEQAPAAALFVMPVMRLQNSALNGVFAAPNGTVVLAYASQFSG